MHFCRVLLETDWRWIAIVSAPLWDSTTSTFAGLLTSTDFINVIQYYIQSPGQIKEVENLRLSGLRGTQYCAHALYSQQLN